jgi:hypothetical protein
MQVHSAENNLYKSGHRTGDIGNDLLREFGNAEQQLAARGQADLQNIKLQLRFSSKLMSR